MSGYTSATLRGLRKELDLTTGNFAMLMGLSTSAIGRWEQAGGVVNIDPGHHQMLNAIQRCIADKSAKEKKIFVDTLKNHLVIHGRLRALKFLLDDYFSEQVL